MARVPLPEKIEKQVLLLCRRRCCICFGLHRDLDVKPGQIAHLNQDNSDNDLDNLAFLCLTHHDQYDSKTSQSKGLQEEEVKSFRDELHEASSDLGKATLPPQTSEPIASKALLPEASLPRAVNVKLTPSEGQASRMLLAVQNLGPKQRFRAQCRILDRRNDPDPTRKVVLNLRWEVAGIKDMTILSYESRNLVIAEADQDWQVEWMKILGISEQPESQWTRGQRESLPEYDLEISVFGDQSDMPHVEQFTVRAGTHTALEMYKRFVRASSDP